MLIAFASVLSVIFLGLALFVFWPLFGSVSAPTRSFKILKNLRAAHFERLRLLDNLQDLELDTQAGKIAPHDAQELKQETAAQLAAIYAKIDELEEHPSVAAFIQKLERAEAKE